MAFLLTDAYSRNYTGALDASCVHSTLAALQTYMYSDATCYAGQIVAVTSDTTAANNGLYLISTNPNFKSGSAKSASNSPFNAVQYSSAAAVDTAIANMAGVLKFMGVLPNGSTLSTTKVKKGYAWLVTTDTGGKLTDGNTVSYGKFDTAGVKLEAGDLVICINGDTEKSMSSITDAEFPSYFAVINKNIDGSVSSSVSTSTDAELVAFDGTSGRQIKGAGQTLSSLKSECKNLANATGTLSVAHGGTGATTVAGAKTAFGIDTLETDVANIKNGTTAAGKATKLATARSLVYKHPTLGNLNEYSANTFDGSKNMEALAIDGIYTGTGIPTAVATAFPDWIYAGDRITVTDGVREYITALELTSGSSCMTITAQLQRFCKVYVNGTVPVALKQIKDTQYVGETVINGKRTLVCVFLNETNGDSAFKLFMIDIDSAVSSQEVFENIFLAVEHEVDDLSDMLPIAYQFVNAHTGTRFIYTGYIGGINKFAVDKWQ